MYHCVDLFIFYSAELCDRALEVRERPILERLILLCYICFRLRLGHY